MTTPRFLTRARSVVLKDATIRLPLRQDRTKYGVQFCRAEIELAKAAVEGDSSVAADHIHAAGPCVVIGFGGAIHAVHHRGPRQVQLSNAEVGVLALFRQVAREWKGNPFPLIIGGLPPRGPAPFGMACRSL